MRWFLFLWMFPNWLVFLLDVFFPLCYRMKRHLHVHNQALLALLCAVQNNWPQLPHFLPLFGTLWVFTSTVVPNGKHSTELTLETSEPKTETQKQMNPYTTILPPFLVLFRCRHQQSLPEQSPIYRWLNTHGSAI